MSIQKFTTTKCIYIAAILMFSLNIYATEMQADVSVSPVGDFTAQFKDFNAKAYKKADGTFYASSFVIPWSGISTGMSLRDKHAQKYVNADKYPNIEVLNTLGKNGKGVSKVKFNNVEKIIHGDYTIEGTNLVAKFVVKLSDFNITHVNFKGAGVNDEVKVKMTVPVQDAPASAATH